MSALEAGRREVERETGNTDSEKFSQVKSGVYFKTKAQLQTTS